MSFFDVRHLFNSPGWIPRRAIALGGALFTVLIGGFDGGITRAVAQGANEVVPTIPGLVVSAPSGPAVQSPPASPPPGVFVTPPAPPKAAPPAKPRSSSKRKTNTTRTKSSATRSASAARSATSSSGSRIVALVNDVPITGFEVEQRAKFMALSTNISDKARANMKAYAQNPNTNERLKAILQETIAANKGKSREKIVAAFEARKKAFVLGLQRQAVENARASVLPTLKKDALDELIEERLKLQEAKKLSITVQDSEVDRIFGDMAKRNKMSAKEFAEHVDRQGASASVIKSRLKASLVWREVVRKRYGHHVSVSQRDIERMAAQSQGEDALELHLQKISIATSGTPDQRTMAARLVEANAVRGRFKGCKSTAGIAKGQANAKFEDLGYTRTEKIAEPVRSLLLAAKDGEMLPPNLGASGVELYAVCGRRSAKIDEEKRQAAENKLTMKEFEKLAQRYLYDLRKDALIEMR